MFNVYPIEDKNEMPELIYKSFKGINNRDCKSFNYKKSHYLKLAFERKEFLQFVC